MKVRTFRRNVRRSSKRKINKKTKLYKVFRLYTAKNIDYLLILHFETT